MSGNMLSCIRNITLRTIKKPEGTNVPIVSKRLMIECLTLAIYAVIHSKDLRISHNEIAMPDSVG